MIKVELFPDLLVCIETVAKREFQETQRRLISENENNEELKEKAETLRLFLQTADFKKLRAESEPLLVKGLQVKFVLYLKDGTVNFRVYKRDGTL